jgi:lipopolysaccharide biosynthesis glycosyltransferase
MLPVKSKEGDTNYTVDCEGVIVRTEDENKGGFNIAIFFNTIKDEQRKKISKYINQFVH